MLNLARALIEQAINEVQATYRTWEAEMWDRPWDTDDLHRNYSELHKVYTFLESAKKVADQIEEDQQ